MLFWITNRSLIRRNNMNKQLCKELATGVAIGIGIAVSKTTIIAGTVLLVGATMPDDAYEEKPTIKQRLSLGIIGSALIGAGAIGVKASIDALYPDSRFKIIEPTEDLFNAK